jgi:S-formylglutathione hydrolase FrmB
MAFVHISWSSQVLGKAVGTNLILPDVGKPPFPVFYLLHGLSDDYTMWQRRTRIEWYVRQLPLIVAMPDGFRGFYTNHHDGPAYATYMAEELPTFVERHFRAKAQRAARCVGGLSMGGYGALRLALGYPDRYVSANSHSGAVLAHELIDRFPEGPHMWGPQPVGTDHDLLHLARRAQAAGEVPALRLDCGTEDYLLDQNRRFHAALDELGLAHEYAEAPGAHTWDYWDTHVLDALAFHCRHLHIGPA